MEVELGEEGETGLKKGGGRDERGDVTPESKQKLQEGNTVEAESGTMGVATTRFELFNEAESGSVVGGGVGARCGIGMGTRVLANVGTTWFSLSKG